MRRGDGGVEIGGGWAIATQRGAAARAFRVAGISERRLVVGAVRGLRRDGGRIAAAEAVEDDVGSNRGPGGVGAGFSLRIRPMVVVPRCKPARASVSANFFLPAQETAECRGGQHGSRRTIPTALLPLRRVEPRFRSDGQDRPDQCTFPIAHAQTPSSDISVYFDNSRDFSRRIGYAGRWYPV